MSMTSASSKLENVTVFIGLPNDVERWTRDFNDHSPSRIRIGFPQRGDCFVRLSRYGDDSAIQNRNAVSFLKWLTIPGKLLAHFFGHAAVLFVFVHHSTRSSQLNFSITSLAVSVVRHMWHSSLTNMQGAPSQAPRHSANSSVNLPSGVVSPGCRWYF